MRPVVIGAMAVAWLGATGCFASLDASLEEGGDAPRDTAYIECPTSTRWNGDACVWRYVITDVSCPQGAVWDGNRCVSTHVTCPDGAAWDGTHCLPIGQPPSEDAPEIVDAEPLPDDAMYEERGASVEPPADAFKYR
jgi:hypothetical protein